MKAPDYSTHKKVGPLQALAFRSAARYEPALEGLTRAFVSRDFIVEREHAGHGVDELVRAALKRFDGGTGAKKMWNYTKAHSIEVARFSYVMARESQENGPAGMSGLDPQLAFSGGLVHDVGKTFIPIAILVKELGIDFGLFTAFRDAPLTAAERRIMREEHVAIGTRFVRLFGGGPHIRMMLDMVGLHHVMYNGLDSGVPSYPSLISGRDLPPHARIIKVADFLSAVLPRHYRLNGHISSLDHAVAYAITAAETELDPVSLRCFITGTYDIGPNRAEAMISRLKHPDGQHGVSSIGGAREYAKGVVREDREFKELIMRRNLEKERRYEREMGEFSRAYSLPPDCLRST